MYSWRVARRRPKVAATSRQRRGPARRTPSASATTTPLSTDCTLWRAPRLLGRPTSLHQAVVVVDRADGQSLVGAVGEAHWSDVPGVQPVVVRRGLAARRSLPSASSVSRPSIDVEVGADRAALAGSSTLTLLSPSTRTTPVPTPRGARPREARRGRWRAAGSRPPPPKLLAAMTSSPVDRPADGFVERGLDRRREHGEQRHDADTDHQRGGRPRRAPGVAHRVAAGQRPGNPRRRGRGAPISRLAAAGHAGPNTTHADDVSERAEPADAERAPSRAAATTRRRRARRARAPRRLRRAASDARFGRRSSPAAPRAARPATPRTPGRAGQHRHDDTGERHDDRAWSGSTSSPPAGSAKPNASNIAFKPWPNAETADQRRPPMRSAPTSSGLGQHRSEDLPARRADRPQQRRAPACAARRGSRTCCGC